MSTLRECVGQLWKMMNFMVLDVSEETKEELLVTMETDDVEGLIRMLEEDTAGRLQPVTATQADLNGCQSQDGVSKEAVGDEVGGGASGGGVASPTPSNSSKCDEGEELDERRKMLHAWRSSSSNAAEDERHLTFVTGTTLLHIACRYGALNCIRCLLENPGFHPNLFVIDYGGALPLHCAVNGNKAQVVELLLAAGSRVNVGDVFGRTALHIACSKGYVACVRSLLQAAESSIDLNARDPDGFTPLISTMLRQKDHYRRRVNGQPTTVRHVEVMQMLIRAGVDLEATAHSGISALHLAVHLADIQPFLDCLLDSNVDINRRVMKREKGISPGSDVSPKGDMFGPTPLWFAIAGNNLRAACKLMLANADFNAYCVLSDRQSSLFRGNLFPDIMPQFASRDFLAVRPLESVTTLFSNTTFEQVMTPFGIAVTCNLFPFAFAISQSGFALSCHDVDWFRCRIERLCATELPEQLALARSGRSMLANLAAVRSLQWWCRRLIRAHLPAGLHRFREAVASLDLPSKIKHFLLLRDVFQEVMGEYYSNLAECYDDFILYL